MGVLIVLTVLWLFSSVKADSKAITTSLTTKWFSTPLLLEASEFLAEDSQEKFWNFVEASQSIGSSDHHGTDYSYYHAILEAAFQFLSPLQQNLLKFCLSLRSYSATIQAFQQIAADEPPPEGCNSFFSVHGKTTCESDTLETLLLTASERPKPLLFKGDHRYPSSNPESPVVIFYSEIGSEEFSNFHRQLISKSNAGKINYVFRHYIFNPRKEPVYLSGYGVELAIKSTEYKAKDDTQVKGTEVNTTVIGENDPIDEVQGFFFGKLRDLHPDLEGQLKELRKHLVESTNEMAPLKVWQLQDLSFQTAARILASPVELALVVMKDLSQNFPTKARAITKTAVSSALRTEVEENQKYFKGTLGLQPGDSALFINGLHIDLDTQDIFSLFDVLRNEARVMEGLHRLGIEGLSLHNVLKLNIQPSEADYAVDIRSPAISWINNLEVDSRYNSWPSSLQELLRPTFPGVIRQIRKNLHNMVFIVDPAHETTAELINVAEMFLSNHIPLRIGFIFVVNDSEDIDGMQDAGVAVLRAYNYVAREVDDYHAFQTLTQIYNKVRTGEKVEVEHVVSVLEKKYPYVKVNSILGIDSAYDQNRKEARGYYEQTGVGPLPVVLFNGMPFEREQLDPDELETITMHKILETTTFFQRAVYLGEVPPDQDVVEYIMNQPNVVPRINSRILTAERDYLDLTASNNFFVDDYARFTILDSPGKTAAVANSMNYLTKKGMSSKEIYDDSFIRPVTFWIVGDFDSPSGRQLLYDAIKHQKSSNNVRISMINNPAKEISYENTQVSRAIWAALQTQTSNAAKNFITKMAKEGAAEALAAGADIAEFSVGGMDFSLFKEVFESSKMDFILSHAVYCRDVLKLKKGQRAVISNGRIIGPLEDGELFNQDDFHLLENIILKTSGQKIKSHIQQLRVEEDVASDLVMKVDALLSAQPKGDARIEYQFFEDRHSAIKLRPKEGETYFDVVAVVDPVTREAQRLAPLLLVLAQLINMNLRVFMNCQSKLSDMPLKSFYRYVLEPEISFTSDNSFAKGPIAKFLDMPQSPLFTLNLNTPESWMVESVRTPYDLDNIYLEEVDSIVAAEYELEYLLLEGHCYDITTGQPPRGLQFTLGTSANPVIVDTIVMANLGYFQLKANPGAWILRLRKGRSEDIYRIYSALYVVDLKKFRKIAAGDRLRGQYQGLSQDPNSLSNLDQQVQKKADMVNEDLLSDGTSENESGFWDSFRWGFTGGQKTEEVKQEKDDIINIFSVASGHLYERFLRIMMLSVLKNTKTPVKFWFLKNYLSPTFKEFIPYMANEYNFQYELVQYKWPRWLHQQTEKQRIIWGYKILFLDVLFPLVVDKFLFVDADQIVRTDLKELRDFSLDGAPYGYTPFCDSRREMDGYRFWKSGYWASHLAGRKYHIRYYTCVLFLFSFLTKQDLPNNMIHQVPIKSLPQEWLWCETWCDDASKKRAKTIDLCNNPMTKEPKLEAAVRIVPEWQDYDQEIKQLQLRFQKEKETGTLYKEKTEEPSREGPQKREEL
ncbi:PREDICTED: UDP-glucose:glycoprotein glucosyltransferase 1 [Colobus angolensis palliatus]|uniref:UDP-glucose:glycoprotein glucosyltransferase 1 n=1 Tax=Colobus angolensis palliatus TaxID=336983 RepID=UPI0005F38CD2|nr:PREDICTED: UDP-glucose:glycoprotein glucosyltransferase 1 [Colobus angolensis palliatus]